MRNDERSIRPRTSYAKFLRRMLCCAAGAALALGTTLYVLDIFDPFLLASLGGTTVFLFGLTRAPAAQPRALFGGHLGGALIGIACYHFLGDATWVYVLALTLTLVFMLCTRTVHPPAGANPLIMIQSHATISALWQPVGLGILLLALIAFVWSRIVPDMVHYPVRWLDESPPSSFWGVWDD